MFRKNHWKIHNLYCSIEKEYTRTDKNGEEITKSKSYMLPFIDSKRSMACLLSAITLLKEFKELNENTEIMINNRKLAELNISSATVFLNTQILKMIL